MGRQKNLSIFLMSLYYFITLIVTTINLSGYTPTIGFMVVSEEQTARAA